MTSWLPFTLPAWDVDFKGQALAERLYQAIIVVFSVVGFVVGWWLDDFQWTWKVWLAGATLAAVVTVVPWPVYRRAPVPWLTPEEAERPFEPKNTDVPDPVQAKENTNVTGDSGSGAGKPAVRHLSSPGAGAHSGGKARR